MILKYVVWLFVLKVTLEIELNQKWVFPDYDFKSITVKDNLRRRFLNRKIENKNKNMRLKMFDTLSVDTVFSDNILHMKINKYNSNTYETMFRHFLSMDGVTYVFKRDFHWRTWRKIKTQNNETVVCYKCQNYLNASCAKCFSGYWIIDENPHCPYEIYSVIKPKVLCAINITRYYKPFEPCPEIISLDKLMETCNNPIKTIWRIQRNYSGSENAIKICQGKDACKITTLYTINQDSITFRIINSSNQIIFSRVMKSGENNYACMDDCGYLTANNEIVKNDKRVVFNLLPNLKNKRENFKETFNKHHKLATSSGEKPLKNDFKNHAFTVDRKPKMNISASKRLKQVKSVLINKKPRSEKSQCNKLRDVYVEIEKGSEYYDF